MDFVLCPVIISEPIEPPNARLFTEPCQLTLCVVPGIPLDNTCNIRPFVTGTAFQILQYLTITDRAQRFRTFWGTTVDQSANFFHQTEFEHPVDPIVDASPGFVPWRIQPDHVDLETL